MSSVCIAIGLLFAIAVQVSGQANDSALELLEQLTSEEDEHRKVAIVEQLDRVLRISGAEKNNSEKAFSPIITADKRAKVAETLLQELEAALSLELVSQLLLTWWRYEDRSKDLAPATAKMMFHFLSDVRHNGKRLSPTTPHERAVTVLSSCTDSVIKDVVDLLDAPELLHRDAAVKILSARGYFEVHFDALSAMADAPERRVRTSVANALAALEMHQNEAIRVALAMLPKETSSDAVATTLATLASHASEPQAASIQLALVRKLDNAKYVTSVYQGAIHKTMPRLSAKVQKAVVRKLIPHLSQQNQGLERAVAAAGTNAAEALPYFLREFEAASEGEKLRRAENLWRIERKAERVLPIYLTAIESPKTTTRWYGFKGLRTLGRNAMPAERRLVELLEHKNSLVVRQSVQTLAEITSDSKSTLEAIAQIAKSHADPLTRKVAKKWLLKLQGSSP